MLKRYIDTLRAEAAAPLKAQRAAQGTSVRRYTKPLTVQIEELMRTLPPAQRDRPWSIDELVCRLEGKHRDRPHPADVGRALRSLGWNRVRDWSSAGGGRRYWFREHND